MREDEPQHQHGDFQDSLVSSLCARMSPYNDNDVKVSSLRVEMSLSHMYPVHIYHIVFF